ncbi:MAG TPA: sugar phosphate isomerase/epimerase [Planctomycetota bacterium]|nr:sugar phosphate isomerase/epimerase [Planctomycetota bacterium]
MPGSVIAAQLYTVREFTKTPADITATMKKVAAIGYQAVQLSALGPMDPKELRKLCDAEGLKICATHIGYAPMRDEPQAVIDLHHTYGCPYAGIGGLPGEYRNAEGFPRFAKEASEVARRLADGGIKFVYHNHSFELEKFGSRTGLAILYEDSDPSVFLSEIDTYWVQHGGGSPATWVRKLKGRAPCLHLKDMTSKGGQQLMAEVGEGNLDWPNILAAAREAGTEWYIVEQDTCQRDPFDSLAISLRNLKAMGLQ